MVSLCSISYFLPISQCSRYERSWGVFFESFEEFLTFSWPVITITDRWTGKAHIVTRMTSIGAFLKMIKTRYRTHGRGLQSPRSSFKVTDRVDFFCIRLTYIQVRRNASYGRQHTTSDAFRDITTTHAHNHGLHDLQKVV